MLAMQRGPRLASAGMRCLSAAAREPADRGKRSWKDQTVVSPMPIKFRPSVEVVQRVAGDQEEPAGRFHGDGKSVLRLMKASARIAAEVPINTRHGAPWGYGAGGAPIAASMGKIVS